MALASAMQPGDVQAHLARAHGLAPSMLSQAVYVLAHAPDLGELVRAGAMGLTVAYQQATWRQRLAS